MAPAAENGMIHLVRGVEKIYAGIERAVGHCFCRIEINLGYRRKARVGAKGHRPESEARNNEAGGAKSRVLHGGSLHDAVSALGWMTRAQRR